MKKFAMILLVLAWLGVGMTAAEEGMAAAEEENGSLSSEERTELIQLLERSRQETDDLVARTADDAWAVKPAEDRWSVGEVVEHLALAEESVYALAMGALEGEEEPEWKALSAYGIDNIVNGLQDRTKKFQAPESFVPKGEMTRVEVLKRYADARDKTLEFVRGTEVQIKRYAAEGPPGKMNVQQWIALAGGHNLRHNQQIVEVLEQLEAAEGR